MELSLFHNKVARRRTSEEEELLFYRKQGWVPQLKELVGLKTSTSGPRMSSTKKEEMFVEISSFQKVYIFRVSEIWKFVSRFLYKKIVLPLPLEKLGFEVLNGDGVTKVIENDKTNKLELKHEFSEIE